MTKEDVLKVYNDELERLKSFEPDAEDAYLMLQAYRGTCTRLHDALQCAKPPPGPGDEHGEFEKHLEAAAKGGALSSASIGQLVAKKTKIDEDLHQKQKAHHIGLWEQVGKACEDAGVTSTGLV